MVTITVILLIYKFFKLFLFQFACAGVSSCEGCKVSLLLKIDSLKLYLIVGIFFQRVFSDVVFSKVLSTSVTEKKVVKSTRLLEKIANTVDLKNVLVQECPERVIQRLDLKTYPHKK